MPLVLGSRQGRAQPALPLWWAVYRALPESYLGQAWTQGPGRWGLVSSCSRRAGVCAARTPVCVCVCWWWGNGACILFGSGEAQAFQEENRAGTEGLTVG